MSIKFSDLHDKLNQYVLNLITKKELEQWLKDNIKIKKYLSLVEKYAIIDVFDDKFIDAIKNADNINNNAIYIMYDINCMFDLLFKYVDIVVLSKYRTIENYDLIVKSGFYDYILKGCKSDYDELLFKCDRVTGINELNLFRSFESIINNQPTAEDYERIRDIINNEIDKDKLQILQAVEAYNNPTMNKIVEGISTEALKGTESKK